MNITVKVFKIFAAMSDHRSRERGQRFRRNFDRTGCKKLVVWKHEENVQHRTLLRKLRRGRRPTSNAECRWRAILFLDEADVTAALDPALLYFGDIVVVQTQAHVFFDIVGGNVVAMHRVQDEIAILDNQFGPAFNKAAEPVRMKGDEREQPVQKHEHQSATEGS